MSQVYLKWWVTLPTMETGYVHHDPGLLSQVLSPTGDQWEEPHCKPFDGCGLWDSRLLGSITSHAAYPCFVVYPQDTKTLMFLSQHNHSLTYDFYISRPYSTKLTKTVTNQGSPTKTPASDEVVTTEIAKAWVVTRTRARTKRPEF